MISKNEQHASPKYLRGRWSQPLGIVHERVPDLHDDEGLWDLLCELYQCNIIFGLGPRIFAIPRIFLFSLEGDNQTSDDQSLDQDII